MQLHPCFSLNAQFENQILKGHLVQASQRGGQGGCKLGVRSCYVRVDTVSIVPCQQFSNGQWDTKSKCHQILRLLGQIQGSGENQFFGLE